MKHVVLHEETACLSRFRQCRWTVEYNYCFYCRTFQFWSKRDSTGSSLRLNHSMWLKPHSQLARCTFTINDPAAAFRSNVSRFPRASRVLQNVANGSSFWVHMVWCLLIINLPRSGRWKKHTYEYWSFSLVTVAAVAAFTTHAVWLSQTSTSLRWSL